jgi:membrane-bound lytic murein transglycosylase MltF
VKKTVKKVSKPKPKKSKSRIDEWLERETSSRQKALENASGHFDSKDALTVNTLEAIYGQESDFGQNRRRRGMVGAAGDFQLERQTARRMGLTVGEKNDGRFEISNASAAAAKYLKLQDRIFEEETNITKGLSTVPIKDASERKKFSIAAYNAGEGRIAKAQALAKGEGKDPKKWDDVKEFLGAAGATPAKTKEIQQYVETVLLYDAEFSDKSKADKTLKSGKQRTIKKLPKGGHWVTIHGRHIFIEDK